MPLLLGLNGSSDIRFLFHSGYSHKIPGVSPKNFSRYTDVCSLWHGCIFLCADSLYSLRIHRPLLLVHIHSYFSAFLQKAALAFCKKAGIRICCFIISHVFPLADVLPETALFPFFIGLWLYVWFLLLFPQIGIAFLTFITRIRSHTWVTELKIFLHCFQKRNPCPHIIPVLENIC